MFRSSRILQMQPTARMAFTPAPRMAMRPSMQLRAVPKEEQGAHTISQRIRTLKKIPPELLPVGFVVLVAVGAAVYSLGKKLTTDKSLRLSRSGGH
ncbi:hypothetical protein K402DRAFT_461473 [Aulographum hederae CBS 113979]|uniref:NADH-ubiquinone reductase complex 1 MLRQ subunit n=1 Tax=Aulographum hederae CBS 113979 TaxID=1176131 RepID=A0A6G1H7Q0_9PEZI|nr:hypothetical protein K402DRAFT_461473 [Aulographum hederae CBS 113979]